EMPDLTHAQRSLHRILTRAELWSIPPGQPDGPPAPGSPVESGWSTPLAGAELAPAGEPAP
ncbi:MAG: hypothetical protein ACR2GS_00205, partial [Thermomicrobiales bacterium]